MNHDIMSVWVIGDIFNRKIERIQNLDKSENITQR
jgi:hypothetical protein